MIIRNRTNKAQKAASVCSRQGPSCLRRDTAFLNSLENSTKTHPFLKKSQ